MEGGEKMSIYQDLLSEFPGNRVRVEVRPKQKLCCSAGDETGLGGKEEEVKIYS